MFKKILFITSSVALLSASTTICFKKEHSDPSTIETVPLDGGKCGGKLSVQDMQRQGYEVGDIKISSEDRGLDYIYIFKKDEPKATVTTDGKMILSKEDLRAKMEELKEEDKAKAKAKEQVANIAKGKEIYETTCRKCHGDGTISAYGTARPLKELSTEDIEIAFRDYSVGDKNNGMGEIMKPYVDAYTQDDLIAISAYIQTLK